MSITMLHYAPQIIAAISITTLVIGGSALLWILRGFFTRR